MSNPLISSSNQVVLSGPRNQTLNFVLEQTFKIIVPQGLLQHKTRWHKADEQKMSCQLCDTKLGNRKSIYEHMRNVHFVERQCKFCPFKHADNETVRRHIQEFHRDQVHLNIFGDVTNRKASSPSPFYVK